VRWHDGGEGELHCLLPRCIAGLQHSEHTLPPSHHPTQATNINESNLFKAESHIHVLTNVYQLPIILISPRGQQLVATIFEPGYKPQRAMAKADVKALLRDRQAKKAPTVVITVNYPPTHFEALVPSANVAEDVNLRRSTREQSSSVIALD
jgi:hypothetical protein